MRVAVVGGGIAGLAAAACLARDGHRVAVFERRESPASDGTGILLQPAGIEVLRHLGLAERAFALGTAIERIVALDGDATRMELRYADLRPGLHALGIRRPTLAALLLEAAREAGCEIRHGAAIESLDGSATSVALVERGGARQGPFDLALICDGLGSRLRASVAGETRIGVRIHERGVLTCVGPLPTGLSAHALVQRLDGARDAVGLLPVGLDGGTTPLLSFFWNIRATDLRQFADAGFDGWREHIAGFAPETTELLRGAGTFDRLTFSTTGEVSLRRWTNSRIAVLGDAAHAMNPLLGLGATMALLDSLVLGRCMREHGPDVTAALAAWQLERQRHCAAYARIGRLWTRLDGAGCAGLRRWTFMAAAHGPRAVRRRMIGYICGWRGHAAL